MEPAQQPPSADSGTPADKTGAQQRIVVVGTSGAGKSTFARTLAAACGCPHIELDALYWGPNWQPQPAEDFQRNVAQAAAGDCWVADGNYRAVRDMLWSRATTIVWLNYPFPLVMWRVLRRTLRRGVSREPLWHGNRESLWRSLFTRDSIVWWAIKTHWRRRRELLELRASGRYAHLEWVEILWPAEQH